jgi:protein SCO1
MKNLTARTAVTVLTGLLALGAIAAAAHDASEMDMDMSQSAHRSSQRYEVPKVYLVRQDGHRVRLDEALNDGRPVVLNFIYTHCATICPMSSQLFERFQLSLGARTARVHLVSISIDPEQDTPARLRAYARKYHARAGWDHFTGSAPDVVAVERAFDAYAGEKMGHRAFTLLRAAPGDAWVRLDGFATLSQLTDVAREWPHHPGVVARN